MLEKWQHLDMVNYFSSKLLIVSYITSSGFILRLGLIKFARTGKIKEWGENYYCYKFHNY